MSRYKKLFKEMVEKNPEVFTEFKEIHDKYEKDNNKYREEFNRIGEPVVELIDQYIDDLCRTSEGAGYGMNSTKLPDLFRTEVRKEFPSIDDVGIEVEYN